MKKYLMLVFVILLVGWFSSVVYNHRGFFIKYYLSWITRALEFKSEEGKLNYRLYTPQNISSSKYPLIIYLHGAGQRGNDNKKQLDYVFYKFSSYLSQRNHPAFVIAPQCPNGVQWVNRSNKGIPYTHYSQDQTTESREMKLIVELINEYVANYPIDTNRIYISGFSMGATGTWDILTRYPEKFAAALIFAGYSDINKANLITHIPIWAISGEKDSIAPAKLNENMFNAIQSMNGNCKFTLFENVGHGCVSEAFESENISEWLFSQRRNKW